MFAFSFRWRLAGFARAMLVVAVLLAVQCTARTVYYPRPEVADDTRSDYPLALLKLALSSDSKRYEVRPSGMIMPQSRAIAELASSSGKVDVLWSMTSKAREDQLLAIRIPIDKGLIGWRLMLIRHEDLQLFSNIHQAEQLKPLPAGQGFDWPDLKIFQFNGYAAIASFTYDGLFRQLISGEISYFPRSAEEIWDEAERYKSEGLIVEPNLLLRYPAAQYYFVSKQDRPLADAIERGLEAAIANGSFDKLFMRYHEALIKRADLNNRRVIELKNPFLPDDAPLTRTQLWFHQDAAQHRGSKRLLRWVNFGRQRSRLWVAGQVANGFTNFDCSSISLVCN